MKSFIHQIARFLAGILVLALLLHVGLLLGSGIALRRAYAALRDAGRPMTVAEIVPKPVAPDDNAAPLYDSAIALLQSRSAGDQTLLARLGTASAEYLRGPESSDARAAFAELMADETVVQALGLVARAAARPDCRFDVPYEPGPSLIMPHIQGVLKLNQCLAAKTRWEALQGQSRESWQTIETGLRLAGAMRKDPVMISGLAGGVILQIQSASIRTNCELSLPDDAAASRLSDLLATGDDFAPLLHVLDGERLLMGEWLFNYMRYTDQELRTLIALGQDLQLKWLFPGLIQYRPALQADQAFYLRAMARAAEIARRPYWELPDSDKNQWEMDFPWYSTISRLIMPALSRARLRAAEIQTSSHLTRTGLALKRHKASLGAYPATLSEIDPALPAETALDPFTGRPLVYRPEGAGFVLYSLGENLADDGGFERNQEQPKAGADDLVWRTAN